MIQIKSLRGMVDLLPDQTDLWQKVEKTAREHFRRAGFKEIRTPLIEPTDLFSRSIGENTDVVGKEMYTFLDKGERSCTLRPEGTASVVRASLSNGLLKNNVQKFWYMGPMFRYERPQAGRQRQFHQIGLECFGLSSPLSDAEAISIAWDYLHDLGLKGLTLEINSLGTIEDRKKYKSKLTQWLRDRYEQLDIDSQNRIETNPLRVLDSKNPETKSILEGSPKLIDSLSRDSLERFSYVQKVLNSLKIPFLFNSNLVRGLDYYSHTAFEITSDQLGSQSTVCGGGRYDTLVRELGGIETPAIGWAIGMERLLILAGPSISSSVSPDIYIVNRGEDAELYALCLARALREHSFSVELDNSGSGFSKQFKRADKSGAQWALIIGEDEVSKGLIGFKRLNHQNDYEITNSSSIDSSDFEGLIKLLHS